MNSDSNEVVLLHIRREGVSFPILWVPWDGSTVIQDSSVLWNLIWENREHLVCIAHSHPGWAIGGAEPSHTDLDHWEAMQKALGPLVWPIVNLKHSRFFSVERKGHLRYAIEYHYGAEEREKVLPSWMIELLRTASNLKP